MPDHPIDATATLDGIVALLARAGLSDEEIAAVTGRDPRPVRARLERPAREPSVIERALAARSRRV